MVKSDETYFMDKGELDETILIGEITKSSGYLLAKLFQMERYLLALHSSKGIKIEFAGS